MSVHAVLLVPEPGDKHGLLREGPCEYRPPMAHRMNVGLSLDDAPEDWRWIAGTMAPPDYGPHADQAHHTGYRHALVLAWEGKPMAEGLDRVHRLGLTLPKWPYLHPSTWDNHGQDDIVLDVLDFAEVLIKRGAKCTLVLLDEHDREITEPV